MTRIQEIFKKVKSKENIDIKILIAGLIFVSLIYLFMSINLHNRFMTYALDLGVFDEWIWKISRGKFPYSGVGCNWMIEDHFQIILYLLAPLYWLWNDVRVILIAQSFAFVFAGLPLYLLTRSLTKHVLLSFATVFAYLFFIGTQFAILNEFHQITAAPLFIALAYLFLEKKKIKLFVYSILFLLFIKEDLALLVGAIGLGLLFRKENRKLGLIVAVVGFSFFFFLVYVFMPFISVKGVYDHFHFGAAGKTPVDIIIKVITDPLFFLKSLVWPLVKVKTIIQSFTTFAFFPLLSPLTIIIPLFFDFSTRFIYAGPQFTKWVLVNHHAAPSAVLLAIATIYGVVKLRNSIKNKHLKLKFFSMSAILIISATIVNNLIFHGPINSLFKRQFYEEELWMQNVREAIAQIPQNASVAAQNNLAPHLTHRDDIYRIPFGLNSQYMVVDLHAGATNYAYAPLSYQEMKDFVDELLSSKRYSIVYQKGEAMLLKRNYKTDITKSKYYGDTRYCYYSFEER